MSASPRSARLSPAPWPSGSASNGQSSAEDSRCWSMRCGRSGNTPRSGLFRSRSLYGVSSKHEEHSADDTKRRPQEVEPRRLAHVEHSEWDEHYQRYCFLKNLQLRQRQLSRADSVCRDHEHVLEQSDPPAQDHRDIPFAIAEITQMRVPREGHEDV